MNNREAAARALHRVFQGESLNRALPGVQDQLPENSRAVVQALVYGAIREHQTLSSILAILLKKPIRAKEQLLECYLRIGLFECLEGRTPQHAVVAETVESVKKKFRWAAGLANATLRRYLREQDDLHRQVKTTLETQYNLPTDMLEKLQASWPGHWQQIATASNAQAPMTLRVDLSRQTRAEVLSMLQSEGHEAHAHPVARSAISLQRPVPVGEIPGFDSGLLSVQDASAQLAADFLDPQEGQRVLDACAAPGGKAVHILESAAVNLLCLDSVAERLQMIDENLQRCGRQATLKCSDAADVDQWWDGQYFDRILLDAPCSASGVVRRHPDIKLHRTAADVENLVDLQATLLDALWPTLSQGGRLLYATCSVWPEENQWQIDRFLARHLDADIQILDASKTDLTAKGVQILPGSDDMDGFYYAALVKDS